MSILKTNISLIKKVCIQTLFNRKKPFQKEGATTLSIATLGIMALILIGYIIVIVRRHFFPCYAECRYDYCHQAECHYLSNVGLSVEAPKMGAPLH
jgi:preprotein translocase subunit Sss1